MTPNIAIIRWTDTSLAHLEWANGKFTATEFTTLDPDDSYNELTYKQLRFAVYDHEKSSSVELMLFQAGDDVERLCDEDPRDVWDMISSLLEMYYPTKTTVAM